MIASCQNYCVDCAVLMLEYSQLFPEQKVACYSCIRICRGMVTYSVIGECRTDALLDPTDLSLRWIYAADFRGVFEASFRA